MLDEERHVLGVVPHSLCLYLQSHQASLQNDPVKTEICNLST